tara:strand:+ start:180 stop:404 length:225 start_codon:yes stop_codon:yes gene_type:complete
MAGTMHKEQQQNMYDLLVRLADEAYDNVARPTVEHMNQVKYGRYGYTGTLRYLQHHNWIRKIKGDVHHAYKIVR